MIDILLLFDRIVLSIVFASAGLAKAFNSAGSQKAISDFGLPKSLAKPAAFLLPVVEIVTATLLILASSALWGAAAAIGLLVAFVSAIIVNLLRGRQPECNCFGQLHSRPISWSLVARDVAFATGAAVILWEGPGMSLATGIRRLTGVATAQPLPVAAISLAVVGFLVQTFLIFGLLHQHGRLLLRMDKLEQGVPGAAAFALTPPAVAGLPVGAPALSFEVSSPDGRVPLEALLIGGKPVLLIFTDPDCGACAEILPDIERWERQYAELIAFVIISRAPATDNGRPEGKYGFRNIAWQKEREISQSYKIGGIPAAMVVRPDTTIGTWLATGRLAIQSLVMFLIYTRMLTTANELGQPKSSQ